MNSRKGAGWQLELAQVELLGHIGLAHATAVALGPEQEPLAGICWDYRRAPEQQEQHSQNTMMHRMTAVHSCSQVQCNYYSQVHTAGQAATILH